MAGLTYAIPTGPSTNNDHHSALEMYIPKTAAGSIEVVEPLGLLEPAPQCG